MIALFIKTTRAKNYEYIKLVEAYWQDGRSHQRVLFNFGRADLIRQNKSFLNVVKRLCEIANLPAPENCTDSKKFSIENCGEATLYNYGYLAYRKLWRSLGIEGCIEEAAHDTKIEYSLPETVFLMALQHLLEPMSKFATHEKQNRYFKMPEIPLHHLYRALDRLAEQKEEIETGLFQYNYVRTNKTVDVVFYDVTTIHFESVIADELREFGYSKAGKYNEVQVVLGMLIDSDGMPVGYELFKGNTSEGKTLVENLEKIKTRFRISRVIIVADRGINIRDNLLEIKKAGYGYIMAAKIKGASAALQKKVLSDEGFIDVLNKKGELEFRYKVMEHENIFKGKDGEMHRLQENMIVTYSPRRAKKDVSDRTQLVEKANKLLANPEQIKSTNKRGGRKYINQVGKDDTVYLLASEKIEHDAQFDGIYAIQTSEKSMSAQEITDAYNTLWKIERNFRIMKSTLEIRPVYHDSPSRIYGHFVVCFLAFLMERKMEILLQGDSPEEIENAPASPEKIQEALNSLLLAAIDTSEGELFVKVKPHPLATRIFKRLKLVMPQNINSEDNLISCFGLNDKCREPVQMSLR